LTQPVDTFAQAKRGGILKDFTNAEPNSLDPINPQADLNNLTAEVYQTLVADIPGKLGPGEYTLKGGVAESFEIAPDGLQITFRLRPNAKWHNIAPVSGRAFDTEDVLFSLNRFAEQAPLRSLIWNSANPDAFALAPEAPDNRTVTIKLTEPVFYAIYWFAQYGSTTGAMLMYPKESADPNKLDIRQTQIGTGPLQLKEHVPSVRFVYERNPDYWDPDFMLLDGIEMPIVPEYVARQGQLKAGEIYTTDNRETDIMRAEDVLLIKQDQDDLLMYESGFISSTSVMTFGWQGENRFKDERVRQAICKAFDRDLSIGVTFNVEEFEQAGIPVRTGWNSHMTARDEFVAGGWFLDPQSADMGDGAANWVYDIAEAKGLLSAAGFPDGFDMNFYYPNAPQFNRKNLVEPYFFFLQEIGLNVIDAGQTDYTQDYIPKNRDASGAFDGMAYHSVTGSTPVVIHPVSQLVAEHWPGSGLTFHGYSADGGSGKTGDPELVEVLTKARIEKDVEAAKRLAKEAQKLLGERIWSLPEPGGATAYFLAWPAVQNLSVNRGEAPWDRYQIWLDQTKAPLA
jgi:peptide/nickel transport system substrate-binding protein